MRTGASQNRLASLEGTPGVSPDLLRLESRLLDWRESLAGKIRSSYPDPEPDLAAVKAALMDGQALATVLDPLPETRLLSDAAAGFFEVTAKILPLSSDLSGWFTEGGSSVSREEDLARWFTASWKASPEDLAALAEGTAIEADLLVWAGRQMARPFFHRLGELLASCQLAGESARTTAHCPSCGGLARLSRYESEEGRRYLWCDLCNVQWPFHRLTCPFCDNREQKKLGYLTIEDTQSYRIDVCEVCRGYLRAIDERDLPEGSRVDFLLEDVGTLHLCMVAEKQGYRQGSPGGGHHQGSGGACAPMGQG